MTTPVDTVKIEGMSMADYLERTRRRPIKLIDGNILTPQREGAVHSRVLHHATWIIGTQVTTHNPGRVFVERGYILPAPDWKTWVRAARAPDLLFYSRSRFEQYRQLNPDWKSYPLALIPDLVIEVLSANDGYSDVVRDVTAYRNDGVKLILHLDPVEEQIIVHTPEALIPVFLKKSDTLKLDVVTPDFSVPVRQFFKDESEA